MTRRLYLSLGLALFLAVCLVASDAETVLYEGKSAFNNIVVTEDDRGLRTLLFEKGGARQSVVKPGDPDHLELPYARVAMTGLALCENPRRVLVVGLGGGTIPMFLRKHYPQATIDAVEIDPEVARVAKKFFGFREDSRMRVHTADGRRFIEQCRQPYDIIFLDAFGPDSIPQHLATVEFLRSVRRALTPRGLVAGNVWSRSTNRQYDAMVRTYQEVFSELCIIRVEGAGNRILIALPRAERVAREDLSRRAAAISKQHGFRFDLGELVSRGFQAAREKDAQSRILTDQEKPDPQE
ncbi:MAG: fused MFS/spermidine synthase [Acidobacteria bacterium]|nr:fused MFS/spermidine synthase [Acidobacteriota bacterium]